MTETERLKRALTEARLVAAAAMDELSDRMDDVMTLQAVYGKGSKGPVTIIATRTAQYGENPGRTMKRHAVEWGGPDSAENLMGPLRGMLLRHRKVAGRAGLACAVTDGAHPYVIDRLVLEVLLRRGVAVRDVLGRPGISQYADLRHAIRKVMSMTDVVTDAGRIVLRGLAPRGGPPGRIVITGNMTTDDDGVRVTVGTRTPTTMAAALVGRRLDEVVDLPDVAGDHRIVHVDPDDVSGTMFLIASDEVPLARAFLAALQHQGESA